MYEILKPTPLRIKNLTTTTHNKKKGFYDFNIESAYAMLNYLDLNTEFDKNNPNFREELNSIIEKQGVR